MNGDEADLAFLPLGGTGEIGMNLNLYRCNGKWLAVDCGIGFGGSEYPEVDIMTPILPSLPRDGTGCSASLLLMRMRII